MVSYKQWREEELWTQPINELLNLNIVLLKRVYNTLAMKNRDKKLTMNDIMKTFVVTDDEQLRVSERQCRMAYGLAHMPVIAEEHDTDKYEKIIFVEFLDFICRLALFKFENYQELDSDEEAPSDSEGDVKGKQFEKNELKLSLERMIELMLDRIFWSILEEKRLEPIVESEPDLTLESDSDTDYED